MAELTRQFAMAHPPTAINGSSASWYPWATRPFLCRTECAYCQYGEMATGTSGSNLPSWRETPVDKPNLQFSVSSSESDRETTLDNDLSAERPADAQQGIQRRPGNRHPHRVRRPRMARWAWWDNLEKMLSDILNVALLVATPLVPGLGQLMLAYTAYQLTDGVVEGLVDLAEGHLGRGRRADPRRLQSVIQLRRIRRGRRTGAMPGPSSRRFRWAQPVKMANGKRRIWRP